MKTTRSTARSAALIRSHSALAIARAGAIFGVSLALALPAAATSFTVVNLVTDDQSVNAAQITDPNLKNAWGISYSPTSPFWVSSNEVGLAVLYRVDPLSNATTKQGLEVTIPGAGNVTGQAFNPASAGNFNGDLFLFVSEDGTISGWKGSLGTNAEVLQTGSTSNSYKGAAIGVIGSDAYLYAADFAGNQVDILKGNAAAPDLAGSFTDPGIPAGYAPFNVQNLGGTLYVTYALRDPVTGDDVAGPGNGFVSAFDLQGNFLGRIASDGTLNAPWGLAIAPGSFGEFAGDLLVGNFGDGLISAFDVGTHAFEGLLRDLSGNPVSIDGLWALIVGNGGNAGSPDRLYFSAGPDGESNGLFGVIHVPAPATAWLVLLGLAALARTRPKTPR